MGHPFIGQATGRSISHRRRAPSGWPFKVQPVDAGAVTDYGVGVPRRQEVEFADRRRIFLDRVMVNGTPDLFLRDLGAPASGVRVDLRRLVPELAKDLPAASTRDVPGIVHFSLRGQYRSVADFVEAAVRAGRPV